MSTTRELTVSLCFAVPKTTSKQEVKEQLIISSDIFLERYNFRAGEKSDDRINHLIDTIRSEFNCSNSCFGEIIRGTKRISNETDMNDDVNLDNLSFEWEIHDEIEDDRGRGRGHGNAGMLMFNVSYLHVYMPCNNNKSLGL